MRLAVDQDPLNVSWRAILASHLVHAGEYDAGLQEVQKALDIDSDSGLACLTLAEAYEAKGLIDLAVAAAERAYAVAPWSGNAVGMFAGLLSQVGQAERGEELMRRLESGQASRFSRVYYHVLRSEIDLAAAWYEKSIEQRELFAIICAPAPFVKPLRNSGRWPRLATLMNMPTA